MRQLPTNTPTVDSAPQAIPAPVSVISVAPAIKYTFIYNSSPEGGAVRLLESEMKAWVDAEIERISKLDTAEVVFGYELIHYYVRLAVAKGRLPFESTVFKFNDKIVTLGSTGTYTSNPWTLPCKSLDAIQELGKIRRVKANEHPD